MSKPHGPAPISVTCECPWCGEQVTLASEYGSPTARSYLGSCHCGAQVGVSSFPPEVMQPDGWTPPPRTGGSHA